MSAALNEAETKFFTSRGEDVDASLSAPPEPAPEQTPAPAAAPAQPEAPAAKAPEPKPAEAPKATESDDRPGFVRQEALHAERQRRQQLEAEHRALMQQVQEMRQAMQQAQAPQAPDPNEDPQGYLAWQNQQLSSRLEQIDQWRAQQEQQTRQQQAYASFTQQVQASENAFRAAHPDYEAAAQFGLQQYDKLLSAQFPDPGQRAQQIQIAAAQALSQAVQQGRDPAEFIYSLARNMGYAPAQAAPAAPAPAEEVVKTIQKGLAQQSNLSAGGSTPPTEMTPEMLAGIRDPVEFNKQWAKMFRR